MSILSYIFYCFTYLLCFLHYQKTKLILVVGSSMTNSDYLIIYLIIGLALFLITRYCRRTFKKKKFTVILLGIYSIFCLFYSVQPYVFLHKYIYFFEEIFFYFFGLLGVILPLIFTNQLLFLGGLIILLSIHFICKFISINSGILGVWQFTTAKHWGFLIFLTLIYILLVIGLDILNCNNTKNTDTKSSFFGKSKKIIPKDTYKPFTKEDINKIYKDIPINDTPEEILIDKILEILFTFHIEGVIVDVLKSATVTNYFFKPKSGTKTSRIESIEEELSIELQRNVRVATNMKGIILEVTNLHPQSFSFKNIWTSDVGDMALPLFLGIDTFGEKVIMDLAKQPHILMCGTTGSGKSSTLHAMIHSLITIKSPEQIKFIFIDPKILELSIYKDIPHLWQNIITSLEEAENVLQTLVHEMEHRYKLMSKNNKRSILEFNKNNPNPLPYLVFCIEEFADLALYKNNSFKISVQRLAQMGRAAGIHGIICTQRPSVNVIDGVIKSNFSTRIALKVANKLESRIILDMSGAERLCNPGEMIISDNSSLPKRAIAPYITEEEIITLINYRH